METIRKYKLTIYPVVLILAVGFVIFYSFGPKGETPDFGQIQAPQITSYAQLGTKDLKIGFVTKRKLPSEAKVFKIKKKPLSSNEVNDLAESFGFKKSPSQEGASFVWREDGRKLIITTQPFTIDFNDFTSLKSKKKLSKNGLITKAKEFLSSKGLLNSDLEPDQMSLVFLAGGPESHLVSSLEKADVVKIPFNIKKDGLYLFYQSPFDTPVTVTIGRGGGVTKMTYQPPQIESEAVYPIKSLEAATEQIVGRGSLIYPDPNPPVLAKDIKNIRIEDAFLAYYVDQSNSLIQPIYVFRGRSSGAVETDVIIYLPALENEWVK